MTQSSGMSRRGLLRSCNESQVAPLYCHQHSGQRANAPWQMLLVALGCAFAFGCSHQTLTIVCEGHGDAIARKRVILEGKIADIRNVRANYSISEQFEWGARSNPRNGWWADIAISVERVRKGDFDKGEIRLTRANILNPKRQSEKAVLRQLVDGQRVLVAFDEKKRGAYTGLVIAPLPPDSQK